MGTKSGLIGHPKQAAAEKMRAEGASYDAIAQATKIPRGQVERYFRAKEKGGGKEPWRPPVAPPNTAGKSSREAARMHAEWLHDCLEAAAGAESGASVRDIALLSGQYTRALQHRARLDGSLDLTAAQVSKTPAWRECEDAVRRAIGDNLEILKRLDAELKALGGDE